MEEEEEEETSQRPNGAANSRQTTDKQPVNNQQTAHKDAQSSRSAPSIERALLGVYSVVKQDIGVNTRAA
ncbi:hypothetical protein GN956_G18080 [Arapaima gigas]